MSDEAAATPSPEAAPATPTTVEQAKSFIGDALRRQAGQAEAAPTTNEPVPPHPNESRPLPPKGPDGKFQKAAEPENRVEGEPEAEPQGEAEASSADQDASEDQGVEVPDTIQGLAEQFGVDPEDLLGHLRVEVKDADGKPVTMSVAEALRGTLREQDYTRKTQALAEKSRAVEAREQQGNQAINAKLQQLENVHTVLVSQLQTGLSDQQLNAMIDPNSPSYNPTEYVTAKAQRDQRLAALNQSFAALNEAKQQAEHARQQQLAQFRQEQQNNLKAWLPEAAESAKLTEFESKVRDYMMKDIHPTAKFTQAEVDSWFQNFDARQVLIVRDAMAFRALTKGKETTVKTLKALPRVSKPNGAGVRTNAAASESAKSRDRLRVPGASKDDALRFLKGIVRA